MKKGNTSIALLVIVAMILFLSLAFVINDKPQTTGQVTLDLQEIACNPANNNAECPQGETCQWYTEYNGYFCGGKPTCDGNTNEECEGKVSCDPPQVPGCETVQQDNRCVCVDPCEEPDSCSIGNPADCGAQPNLCFPTDTTNFPNSFGLTTPVGSCDCNNDGCTEGASCTVFAEESGFSNVCGPNGFCQPTQDPEGGGVDGQCVCGNKPCEYLDGEGFDGKVDQCPNTVNCEQNTKCNSHSDCGGVGVGICNGEGFCDCECVAWAPCQNDDDCGDYGEDGNYGRCEAGPDGALECMCTDEIGCSPDDCVPGQTPCDGENTCGQDGEGVDGEGCIQVDGEAGICVQCGVDCQFNCAECNQAQCDELADVLGSDAGCTFDGENNQCDCPGIPEDLCDNCYGSIGNGIGNCD